MVRVRRSRASRTMRPDTVRANKEPYAIALPCPQADTNDQRRCNESNGRPARSPTHINLNLSRANESVLALAATKSGFRTLCANHHARGLLDRLDRGSKIGLRAHFADHH